MKSPGTSHTSGLRRLFRHSETDRVKSPPPPHSHETIAFGGRQKTSNGTDTLVQSKTIAVFFLPTAFVATDDGRMEARRHSQILVILSDHRSVRQNLLTVRPSVTGGVSSGACYLGNWDLSPLEPAGPDRGRPWMAVDRREGGRGRCLFKFCRLFVSGWTAGGILTPLLRHWRRRTRTASQRAQKGSQPPPRREGSFKSRFLL